MGAHGRVVIREATNQEDRLAVERLRYRVYVEEMGLFGDVADHDERRLEDGHDSDAHVFVAEVDGRVVGSNRVIWAAEADTAPWEHNFSCSLFLQVVDPERLCVFGRFVIDASFRSGETSVALLHRLSTWALGRRIDVGVCDCEPHLVPFYESMGFRPYRSVYNDPNFGLKVPLVDPGIGSTASRPDRLLCAVADSSRFRSECRPRPAEARARPGRTRDRSHVARRAVVGGSHPNLAARESL